MVFYGGCVRPVTKQNRLFGFNTIAIYGLSRSTAIHHKYGYPKTSKTECSGAMDMSLMICDMFGVSLQSIQCWHESVIPQCLRSLLDCLIRDAGLTYRFDIQAIAAALLRSAAVALLWHRTNTCKYPLLQKTKQNKTSESAVNDVTWS